MNDCNHSERIEDYRTGDEVCTRCGLVVNIVYDSSPEFRIFQNESLAKIEKNHYEICNVQIKMDKKNEIEQIADCFKFNFDAINLAIQYYDKYQYIYDSKAKSYFPLVCLYVASVDCGYNKSIKDFYYQYLQMHASNRCQIKTFRRHVQTLYDALKNERRQDDKGGQGEGIVEETEAHFSNKFKKEFDLFCEMGKKLALDNSIYNISIAKYVKYRKYDNQLKMKNERTCFLAFFVREIRKTKNENLIKNLKPFLAKMRVSTHTINVILKLVELVQNIYNLP